MHSINRGYLVSSQENCSPIKKEGPEFPNNTKTSNHPEHIYSFLDKYIVAYVIQKRLPLALRYIKCYERGIRKEFALIESQVSVCVYAYIYVYVFMYVCIHKPVGMQLQVYLWPVKGQTYISTNLNKARNVVNKHILIMLDYFNCQSKLVTCSFFSRIIEVV